jgi:hypothetical protein
MDQSNAKTMDDRHDEWTISSTDNGRSQSALPTGSAFQGVRQAANNAANKTVGYLKKIDSQQLTRDIDVYARRRPWVIASAGLIVGFAAGRILKW